ncbi:hypothetical protein [Microbacterium candidum]|uniref:Uncharacterized protein n=1 Tax=Microbacterium candidum TaxID=3041922 RepID=A0ABT7N2M1_9MICO|nr:hypothetical protein [Microbacterium sp. ASV49]MDL9980958.1 hypothetical protein [Microbacterium sp. ASV49]
MDATLPTPVQPRLGRETTTLPLGTGDDDSVHDAVAAAFGLDEDQARAVVDLQVRRLSPLRTAQIGWEIAEVDRILADFAG